MGGQPGSVCVKCGGEFFVGLAGPAGAEIHVGYVYLSPGAWGTYAGLPVLQSAVDTLQQMGITMIRQGGSVAQTLAWKDWRGAPWERRSLGHVWGGSLVSGWGPFEFLAMCEAADILPVVTLAWDLNSVQDWADLVDYLHDAGGTTEFGALRIADGHAGVYNLTVFELGTFSCAPAKFLMASGLNRLCHPVAASKSPPPSSQATSRRTQTFSRRFWPWRRAARLSARRRSTTCIRPTRALNSSIAAALLAAGVDAAHIMPDMHVGWGGGIDAAQAAFAALPGFHQSSINVETNAATHDLQRGIEEAIDLSDWFNAQPPFADRLFGRAASFCSERSGHFDAYDQGISFFLHVPPTKCANRALPRPPPPR